MREKVQTESRELAKRSVLRRVSLPNPDLTFLPPQNLSFLKFPFDFPPSSSFHPRRTKFPSPFTSLHLLHSNNNSLPLPPTNSRDRPFATCLHHRHSTTTRPLKSTNQPLFRTSLLRTDALLWFIIPTRILTTQMLHPISKR